MPIAKGDMSSVHAVFKRVVEADASDSDKLRVVLIFDIWHPHLTPPERAMIMATAAAMNGFVGGSVGFEL